MTDPEPTLEDREHPAIAALTRDIGLGEGAKQGAMWLGIARVGIQVTQFLFSIVTARLLLPAEFGEAALALVTVGFALIFTELGMGNAIVHARRVTDDLLNSAFWLSTGISAGLGVLVAALAWPIAELYGHTELFPLMLLASLNFVTARGVVQVGLLERTFNYRKLATIEAVGTGVGIVLVPVFAVANLGAMSLVLGAILGNVVRAIGFWTFVPWRPTGGPIRADVSRLWGFSKGLVGWSTMTYWSQNLDTVLLGATASTRQVGEYNRAFNLMMVPIQQVNLVFTRVMFPSLARLRDDRDRLTRAWLRGVETATAVSLPITLTFAATAPAMVAVLYGPRWAGTVPVLELLALAAVPQMLASSTGALYRATGQTGLLFRVGILSTMLTVAAIVEGLSRGTEGVATALLVKAVIVLPVPFIPIVRMLGIQPADLLRLAGRVLIPVVPMVLGELAVRRLMPHETAPGIVLVNQLAVGGALYLLVLWRTKSAVLTVVSAQMKRLRTRRTMIEPPASPDY